MISGVHKVHVQNRDIAKLRQASWIPTNIVDLSGDSSHLLGNPLIRPTSLVNSWYYSLLVVLDGPDVYSDPRLQSRRIRFWRSAFKLTSITRYVLIRHSGFSSLACLVVQHAFDPAYTARCPSIAASPEHRFHL